MDLRPWITVSRLYQPPALSARLLTLHREVAYWRGVRVKDLRARYSADDIQWMLDEHELYLIPSLIGPCVMLGPRGRVRAGQRADNRPSVESIMNAAYMAHAVGLLVSRGWEFRHISPNGRGRYLMVDPEGSPWTVIGQARGHTPRTLRRIVREMRFEAIRLGQRILIVTPDRRRTYGIARKNTGIVDVMALNMSRTGQDRSARLRQERLLGVNGRLSTQAGEAHSRAQGVKTDPDEATRQTHRAS